MAFPIGDIAQLTGLAILALVVYKFVLGTMSMVLGFIARRTENKLDDKVARLLNKMANYSKTAVDILK